MRPASELNVEPIGLDVEKLPRPIVWGDLFANDHPVELEIGMGKGTFLTETAKSHPDVNFFGLEYVSFYWRYASDRLRRNGCTNARTARAEAFFFLRECVADESLSKVHIYFPDPWPKKRHQKRRLIQPPFMLELRRTLVPAGRVQIVTDHEDYFRHIEQVLASSPLSRAQYESGEIGTNFERKYAREGRRFFAIAAVK